MPRKPPAKRKVVVLTERKLGREQAHGQVWDPDSENPLIEIDPKLTGKDRLTILCHEAIHVGLPTMSEAEVVRVSKIVAAVLWADNYRRVDQ